VPEAVLLVAHGSRSAAGQQEMAALASAVEAARPAGMVRFGYLELSDPPASRAMDDLLAAGARDIVVVPLMLHAAGHAKSDVPAVVLDARARHPDARITYGRPFGVDHALLVLGRQRLEQAGALGLPLALLSRGTSDPDANAEAYRACRLLAEMTGARPALAGFAGVTWPDVTGALDELRRLGATRIATLAWFLATGVLLDRMREDYRRFEAATGIEVIDAGHLGTGVAVASLVLERIAEAAEGRTTPNCDACAYRRPFPGLETRVGLSRGHGHSHLAFDHLHAGHGHDHGHDEGAATR
jgi:sirohydrochlorin cobaltochelatase